MKRTLLCMAVLLAVVVAVAGRSGPAASAAPRSVGEPSLRLMEPVEAVAADLERYVPEYMRENHIPGVSMALIRDGQVAWTRAFGVANTLTREPVRTDTVFEVASNSKVMTAYTALRLVDEGVLALDEPLGSYLPEPWLPPSEYGDAVTLRHVLSHSSGLHASVTQDRELHFAPGSHYYYSGVGLAYAQDVIEEVTGRSLEDVAQELVFAPLGMSSSSFVNRPQLAARTANGHLSAILPALLFALHYAAALILVGLAGLVILRIRTGRWRPTWRMVLGALLVAYGLSILPGLVLLGPQGLLEFVLEISLCGLVLTVFLALAFLAGRRLILRLAPRRSGRQIALAIVWSALVVFGLGLLLVATAGIPLPVAKWTPVQASGGGSARATAGDVAALLLELADPQHLSPELAAQLQTPQIRLAGDLSWGLGSGIQHSRQGDALWQWGQHFDFQSVMIIYPEHGLGVVVCTNRDLVAPDVAVDIAHRALGGKIEPIRRAIHLEYNYREG